MKLEDMLFIAQSCSKEIGEGLQALEVLSVKLGNISKDIAESIPYIRTLTNIAQSVSKKLNQPCR